ncbi:hypothetical protein BY996DRAFT_6550482 [Phakopsora pachyrhizi]|nr:hypothetical protein BY996DRAFT_6550482 [Phakopsora pachyrhizi]
MEARQAFIEGILGRRAIAPVFQLRYGMFIHDEETNQIWFNPASTEFEEFKLIGKLWIERGLDPYLTMLAFAMLKTHQYGKGKVLTYDCQQEQRSCHEYVSGMKRIRIIIFSPTNLNRSKPTNSSLKPGLNFLDSESSFYDQTVLTSGISCYPSTQSPVHPDVKTWLRLSGIPGNDDYQEKTLFDKDKSDPTKTNAIFKRLEYPIEEKLKNDTQIWGGYLMEFWKQEEAEEERVFEEMVLKEMKYLNLVQGIHEFLICDEDLGQVQLACFIDVRGKKGTDLLKKNLVTRDQDFIKRSVDKTEHELEEAPKKNVRIGAVENHRKKSSEVDLARINPEQALVLAEVGLMIISPMGIGAVLKSLPAIRKVDREERKVKTAMDYTISKDDGGGKHSTQRDSVKKDKGAGEEWGLPMEGHGSVRTPHPEDGGDKGAWRTRLRFSTSHLKS